MLLGNGFVPMLSPVAGDTIVTALTPLASTGFTFVWGRTDGRGHAAGSASYLTTTAGAGGGGLAWSKSGTSVWDTQNGKAICTTLGATTAFAWVDAGEANVRVELNATRNAGACGVLIRYLDANNYAYVTNTNTNIRVHQVIGGGAASALYDAANSIVSGGQYAIQISGNSCAVYYQGSLITTVSLNAALASATKFGVWTNNVANTLDNFVVYRLSEYPAGTAFNLSKATITVGGVSDLTSAFVPGGTVTQHSWVNATASDASRTSSDPLWGTLGPIAIHLRHFGFSNNMSAQAPGATEADRVTATIAGTGIDFSQHDTVITRLKNNGVTQLVLKAWGFPDWMLDAATGPDAVDRTFLTSVRAEAAAYVRAFVKRYNTDATVAGISIIAVDWGHEWKGGYSSDQARFVADYNAIYSAVKAQDSSVLMAGPYRVIRGNGSVNFGQTDAPETREAIISDDGDKINYFGGNATAFNVLSFDAKTWVDAAPTLTYDQTVQLFGVWGRYIEKLKTTTGYTSQPLMLSEGYGFNINDYAGFTEAQQAALHAAMMWYCVRHGVKWFFHWIVEKPSGQTKYGYWSSTNDNPSSPATTTPAYAVHLAFKNYFSDGTALYPVTVTGDSAGLLVLASATKVLIINLRSASRNTVYNAATYGLAAYEIRVIDR